MSPSLSVETDFHWTHRVVCVTARHISRPYFVVVVVFCCFEKLVMVLSDFTVYLWVNSSYIFICLMVCTLRRSFGSSLLREMIGYFVSLFVVFLLLLSLSKKNQNLSFWALSPAPNTTVLSASSAAQCFMGILCARHTGCSAFRFLTSQVVVLRAPHLILQIFFQLNLLSVPAVVRDIDVFSVHTSGTPWFVFQNFPGDIGCFLKQILSVASAGLA